MNNEELLNKAHEDLAEKLECREIVKEIINFGISQRQLLELINLLALELEDDEQMRSIRAAIKEIKGDAIMIAKAD